ncbi:MAG: deoxyribose-phosphate aldolase [candidate division Zixibacteria bacterium]|nr:deoxyribose-phosphate aldolase [candidate division Zixibacteria bacterium]
MKIAGYIDHTLLKPDAVPSQIEKLCEEADEYKFASVCVNPFYVPMCAGRLKGSEVKVCTVCGFPLGATSTGSKVHEARWVIENGADEVDMVINIGALKSSYADFALEDIKAVVDTCHTGEAVCKVIIETSLLTDDEKKKACELVLSAKADFVKTSTGFGPGGATVEDVRLMSGIVKDSGIGVKAAGGIKNYADAMAMIEAGATRIGASAGVKIYNESLRE